MMRLDLWRPSCPMYFQEHFCKGYVQYLVLNCVFLISQNNKNHLWSSLELSKVFYNAPR